jgi:hypothetical protein
MQTFRLASVLALLALTGCNTTSPTGGSDTLPPPPGAGQPVAEKPASNASASSLDGDWQSLDDPKNVAKIKGDSFASVYDGKVIDTQKIRYVRSCTDKTAAKASEFFLLVSAAGEQCYKLLAVTADSLSYSYVDRGNTLSYKRLK